MSFSTRRFGYVLRPEHQIKCQLLEDACGLRALGIYIDSGREVKFDGDGEPIPEDLDKKYFRECLRQAFDEFMDQHHKGYIEILPLDNMSLKDKGRVAQLLNKHKEKPEAFPEGEMIDLMLRVMIVLEYIPVEDDEDRPERELFPDEPLPNMAENAMKDWLDSKGYAWEYIEQSTATYPKAYREVTKRPDFQVKTPWGVHIAVDVKVRKLIGPFNTFNIDEADEIIKYRKYETMWGIPVWFAFSIEGSDHSEFYWVSLQDVVENVQVKTSGRSGELYRPIPVTLCKKIGPDETLYKLLSGEEGRAGGTSPQLIGTSLPSMA